MTTPSVRRKSFHILLIEDNLDHAELISRNLELPDTNVQIQHVTNGQDALDYIFKRGDWNPAHVVSPHLVLLDLRLPKIDGLEVLRQIKADPEFRNLPVVILTTSESPDDIRRAYEYYTNSYLVKPCAFDELAAILQQCGLYWHRYNHVPHDYPEPKDSNQATISFKLNDEQ